MTTPDNSHLVSEREYPLATLSAAPHLKVVGDSATDHGAGLDYRGEAAPHYILADPMPAHASRSPGCDYAASNVHVPNINNENANAGGAGVFESAGPTFISNDTEASVEQSQPAFKRHCYLGLFSRKKNAHRASRDLESGNANTGRQYDSRHKSLVIATATAASAIAAIIAVIAGLAKQTLNQS